MSTALKSAVAACCAAITFALATLFLAAPASVAQDSPTPREIARSLGKPELPPHSGPVPTVMSTEDIVEGTGAELYAGDTATLQYTAADWRTGEWLAEVRGEQGAVQIAIDQPTVLASWWQGVPGMRVGGRRLIVSPPEMAYGDAGQGDVIRPGQTVSFIVDLLGVRRQEPVGAQMTGATIYALTQLPPVFPPPPA